MKGSFSYQLPPSAWAVFHHCDRCSSFRGRFAELCGNSTRIIQELQEFGLSTEGEHLPQRIKLQSPNRWCRIKKNTSAMSVRRKGRMGCAKRLHIFIFPACLRRMRSTASSCRCFLSTENIFTTGAPSARSTARRRTASGAAAASAPANGRRRRFWP